MSDFIARAGEVVTCQNGHQICDVAVDIARHSPGPLVSQFSNWRDIQEPKIGEIIPPCPHCGAPFIERGLLSARLHIGEEWRP